jgi:TolB-like protein/DNA-binding SARP family transcriptional activator/lipoprotein NlpI
MIEFRLLGSLDLKGPEGTLRSVLAQPKRVALLAYLAVARPNGFHRRDKLLGLFWAERDQEHGRGALRKALYILRQSLGEEVIVSRGDEEIGLAEGTVWCDAVAFEAALMAGKPEEALDLYRGDLLEGFFLSEVSEFERWLEVERERLRARASEAAWSLAEREETAGNGIEAAGWARRAAALLPNDEGALRRVIELLERVGDRAGAMKEYEAFARRLREEYEVEPSDETQDLVARIRRTTAQEAKHLEPLADERAEAGAPVERVPETAEVEAVAETAGVAQGDGSKRRWLLLLAAAAIAIVAGLTWYIGWGRVASRTGRVAADTDAVERKAIAVLPFDNLSGDPEDEYFTAGTHDEIITKLAGIGALKVISKSSVMEFRDRPANLRTVAERLGVSFVLEGGVRRSGDRVRITAQLIDARTDQHLWAETYDRSLRDIFDVQSDVANQVVRALQTTLTPVEQARIARRPTESSEAHNFYLRGLFHSYFRRDPDWTSIEYFARAIEEDPQYALAYVGLADSYVLLAGFEVVRPSDVIPVAREATLRALQIDSLLGEAHTTLAWIKLEYDWDFVGAEREFKRAIELNPSYHRARLWYGVYLRAMGKVDEYLTECRIGDQLNPLRASPAVGLILSDLGEYQRAVEQLRKVLAQDPDKPSAHSWLGLTYAYQGRFEPAIQECETAVELSERHPLWVGILAYVYASAGRPVAARSLLQELQERSKDEYIAAWLFAPVYAKLGEMDLAFQWLEEATEERGSVTHNLKLDPRFAEMRADPRFSALLKRIGLE